MPTAGVTHHLYIGDQGYILATSPRKRGKFLYEKKRAPTFVNKFGGGDSSYRDASFWQFWAQTNWRNGAQQLKFNDFGKFWKSENVDIHELEKLRLSRKLVSIGQTEAGTKNNTLVAWRAAQNWWDASYTYRQKITVTAPSEQVKKGHPIKITIDTAALQTASKVRSDRNDWRVVYFNGSSWVDLTRDYVSGSVTFFGLQTDLAANASDENYYVYYGNSGESTNKQPTTEAEWLNVYGFYRNHDADSDTPVLGSPGPPSVSGTVALYMFREGSGSVLTDHAYSADGTVNGMTWGTDGKFGRYGSFDGTNDYVALGSGSTLNIGSFTIEGWIYWTTGADGIVFQRDKPGEPGTPNFNMDIESGNVRTRINGGGVVSAGSLITGWNHVAVTFDGVTTAKIYINGELKTTNTSQSLPLSGTAESVFGRSGASAGEYFNRRIQHFRVSNIARTTFPYVLSSEPTVNASDEETEQPPASGFELYAGQSNGKIYVHDGVSTFTEVFDTRRVAWYDDTGLQDAEEPVGDVGGTEYAQSQSFQLDETQTIKALEVYLKKNTGTPGDITVRIETDNTGAPSGTLAHANAETTISAFTETAYAWIEAIFTNTFELSASTKYWLVLKTAAAANDNYYDWGSDASSPSYSSQNMAQSTNGGSSWSAVAAADAMFRIKGKATTINCSLVTSIGGTQKMLFGVGDPESSTDGEARIYSFNGTEWSLEHTFANDSQVLSMSQYNGSFRVGTGARAKIYVSTNLTSFTEDEDISEPQNPGYVWNLTEYNGVLYALGGSPEFLPNQYYNGFVYTYDTTEWRNLYPFNFTVVKTAEFYDAFLFIGTYHGHLFIYDTATLTPIFNWNEQYGYNVQVLQMKYYDDKLFIALYPQEGSGETNVGIWMYDRHGLSLAYHDSAYAGYRAFAVVNNELIVGTGDDGHICKVDPNNYATQGYEQSSYFDANLPSINKLFHKVVIRHDPLPAGSDVKLYYKFKEADDWTLLGTSDTEGSEEAEFSFASGTYSKKISLKTEINTINSSVSPVVTERVLQYALYPDVKWIWTFRVMAKQNLKLINRTNSSDDANTIRAAVEALLSTPTLVTFTDIDNTTYSVLPVEVDQNSWVVNQADQNEDEIAITLLEA